MTFDNLPDCFSRNFTDARARFLHACDTAVAAVRGFDHPLRGPENEQLATDTAWVGPDDADLVLVTISGTHGVEGFCGSAIQTDWLSSEAASALPDGVAALHVHALNPYGFAWQRRVNEDGVDLNRNFVDFNAPLPANPGYKRLHPHLLPTDLDSETIAAADRALDEARKALGQRDFEMAVSGGQYGEPSGLFYGGTRPTWSRRTIETVLETYGLRNRRIVAALDIHTGLGPFGYGEMICDHPPGSAEAARGRRWYGASMTEPALGTSTSVPKHGLLDYRWQNALGAAVTFVTLEFGTYPVDDMFRVLRADHILHRSGTPEWTAAETRAVKGALLRHFYPATPEWCGSVLARGRQVLQQAAGGLASARG